MKQPKSTPPTTFRAAYDTLQGHADTLRRQSEPNIDDLLKIVNESVTAYQVCKERIDAVEKALEEALSQVSGADAAQAAPPPPAPAPARASSPASAPAPAPVPAPAPTASEPPPASGDARPDDMDDDDIPF